ncbi:MAG: hypothetical protein ACWA5P_01880 [bacterium]
MQINRKEFYKNYRKEFGRIRHKKTVATINEMLSTGEQRKVTIEQLAYILATAYHEARHRDKIFRYRFHDFFPIRERGENEYFITKYWKNKRVRKWLGNEDWRDAITYRGRGVVQVTGRYHYRRLRILDNPDKLLEIEFSVENMFNDMLDGKYTGKALTSYINKTKVDYVNARRVVNGRDKAQDIAIHALKFEKIIRVALDA